MKNARFLATLLSVTAIAAVVFAASGCKKNENVGGSSAKSTQAAATKNSFREVTSQLDAGGNLFVYVGTEQWLQNLSGEINGWRDAAKSIPDASTDDQRNVTRVFDVVTSLVKNSGVEEISGAGISSIATEKDFYRTKFILHHYKGNDAGYLWSLFGKSPHAFNGLDYLPASTAFATFSDLDLAMFWSVLNKEVGQSGIPGAKEGFNQVPTEFEKNTGLNFDKVLASLGGEFGLVFTLDETKTITLPVPGQPLQIPEPGVVLVVKVKDDLIFNRVDELMKGNSQVIRTDKDGLRMLTMPIPLPLPLSVRPSLARSGDYLFLASNDALINEALAVKAGKTPGLKSTEEFKRLSQGLPTKGNQFSFVSQKFGRTFSEVQSKFMAQVANGQPAQAALMQKLAGFNKVAPQSFSVSANGDEGWVGMGNGNQDTSKLVLLPAVAAPAMVAGMLLPALAKAKAKAQQAACINNLRQIDAAKQTWALENKKGAQDVPTMDDLKPFLNGAGALKCPAGGDYIIGAVDTQPRCSVPGHELP
ncbi:MAG: hypothetical protein JWR26_3631 [Pedosphaera sp.]|nr:hypothetical protein [Pedosphaera sp.]